MKSKNKILVFGTGKELNTILKGIKNIEGYQINVVTPLRLDIEETFYQYNTSLLLIDNWYAKIRDLVILLSNDPVFFEKFLKTKLISISPYLSKGIADLTYFDITMLNAVHYSNENINKAIEKITNIFNLKGEIVPLMEKVPLTKAIYKDGVEVSGTDLFKNEKVISEIEEASMIIFSPNNMYTELLPLLLDKNLVNALYKSYAKKVYIAPLYWERGLNTGYKAIEYFKILEHNLGNDVIDYMITNTRKFSNQLKNVLEREEKYELEFDVENLNTISTRVITADLAYQTLDGDVEHNPLAIQKIIEQILKAEVK